MCTWQRCGVTSMLIRIITVAENGWVELRRRTALLVLLVAMLGGFFAVVSIAAKLGIADMALRDVILTLDRLLLFIGLSCASLFAAGHASAEVAKRTLCSVMIRPIQRWEYLAGRAATVAWASSLFVLAVMLCSYLAAFATGTTLPDLYAWGALQRLCAGVTWILITTALGALMSATAAVATLAMVAVVAFVVGLLPDQAHGSIPVLKDILYYATLSDWPTDFWAAATLNGGTDPALVWNAVVLVTNLLDGAAVFLVCAWIYTKRDLRLRD